jgi:hypothetical protein
VGSVGHPATHDLVPRARNALRSSSSVIRCFATRAVDHQHRNLCAVALEQHRVGRDVDLFSDIAAVVIVDDAMNESFITSQRWQPGFAVDGQAQLRAMSSAECGSAAADGTAHHR